MDAIKEQYVFTTKAQKWSVTLMAIGIVTLIVGYFTLNSYTEQSKSVFWGTILYNSIFFLLICNSSMFFLCVHSLAMGGWITSFRKIPEAISSAVPVLGSLLMLLMLIIIYAVKGADGHHPIYHWLTPGNDPTLIKKLKFLNSNFFIIWTAITLFLWSFLGYKMRQIHRQYEISVDLGTQNNKKFVWNTTVIAALYIVVFVLTMGSTIPWLWMMSIDAHWYSTMFSWYTFSSSFVSGIALIILFVIYLKNKGLLQYTTEEHIHALGKFLFGFSIFWTYLWFTQYMIIWYGNIPEETIYFKHRLQGAWRIFFFLNIAVNFFAPLLILMKKSPKKNYTTMTFMAVLILFGHWIDFDMMVMGSLSKTSIPLLSTGWLDIGMVALFGGIIIWITNKSMSKQNLLPVNNPFFKESIVYHP